MAEKLSMDAKTLATSIDTWNRSARAGHDTEFGRTKSLHPIAEGSLYAMELVPSMLNTQGGPRRNERAEVLRPDGKPINRLYSAGEMGSIFGYLYQGTGNIGECFAFGRIAAREALSKAPW
jgi:predicted oxidoreductase